MRKLKINKGKLIVNLFFSLQIIISATIFTCPLPVAAQTKIPSLNFVPQIAVPGSEFNTAPVTVGKYDEKTGKMNSDLLGRYIKSFYDYGLAIAGILASLVLMGGGVIWMVSGGDSGKVSQAKELISGSISGMVILVVAWVILNTVNPDLVNLAIIKTPVIKKISYCCDPSKGNIPMDKDGKCTGGGTRCAELETCVHRGFNPTAGTNSFACINPSRYFCCTFEFEMVKDVKYCSSVAIGKACADITPPDSDYKYKGSVIGYCSTRETFANTCFPEECIEKENGSVCGQNNNFCYNEICWLGKGKLNEPCGHEDNSKCDPDLAQNGKKCNGDVFNIKFGIRNGASRVCDTGLTCCKFRADGSRINN